MEKVSVLSAESILNELRHSRSDLTRIFEHVEKYGSEKTQMNEIISFLTSGADGGDSNIGYIIYVCNLQEQQKLPFLNEAQLDVLLQWLTKLLAGSGKEDYPDFVSLFSISLCALITLHQQMNVCKHFVNIFNANNSMLLKHLCGPSLNVHLIRCMDVMVGLLNPTQSSKEQLDVCAEMGRSLLQTFYSDTPPTLEPDISAVFLFHALQLMHRITTINPDFAKENVGELLGLARAYLHYGIDNINNTKQLSQPQKVHISQQSLYDSAEEFDNVNSEKSRNPGGKTPKTRKPRLKTNANERNAASNANSDGKAITLLAAMDIRTSDSEASDTQNTGNRVLFERNKLAKIRMAALTIVGSIVRTIERRLLYGYWHALFPTGSGESPDNLLYISEHDPNMRCRCAALQVCAQLLFGSKGFLHQAEINVKRCPTTFIPFSVSLGYTVLAIYRSLTAILSTEASLPVLTQALKCCAILVQATPFQTFEKSFVQSFIRNIRPLIYHRDAAIQVSSLMVMEFLVASAEANTEIAEIIGLPQPSNMKAMNVNKMLDEQELVVAGDEEFVESDISDDDDECKATTSIELSNVSAEKKEERIAKSGRSWLLLRVLHNLAKQNNTVIATSVRIESLQVLIALSPYLAMLQPHMTQVSEVLQYALENPLPDVRLYAARCIDACAYQINRCMADNAKLSSTAFDSKIFVKFWSETMPIIMKHIERRPLDEEVNTVRITLCDALSNIGGVMFENCAHALQISLLSFLSGVCSDCAEDAGVRAAAVRALAVFVLYPSLRDDMVFVENTADLSLRLATDSNLAVRVKVFWSLGNISDALIADQEDPQRSNERISNECLFRMISVSITACGDNDKVRCNAVRMLGNLLRLLTDHHFNSKGNQLNWCQLFEKAICKLTDCLRSSGNAKVKWNTCYAISTLLRNRTIFSATDLQWQATLYSALCYVITHHTNFKVRIHATTAIINIEQRSDFGNYFEKFWSSIMEAIEQSYNLDNFYEYNHRDNLQEQLCLALAHMLTVSIVDDWPMMKKHLTLRVDTVSNTWKRVVLRMVPEKAAPLLSCQVHLHERERSQLSITSDAKNAVDFLVETFLVE